MTKQEHIRHIRLRIQRHLSSIIDACADLTAIEEKIKEPTPKLKTSDISVITNTKKLNKDKVLKKKQKSAAKVININNFKKHENVSEPLEATTYPISPSKTGIKEKPNKYQTFLNMRLEVVRENPVDCIQIRSSEDAVNAFHEESLKYPNEYFKCIHLNSKNFVLGVELISIGSLTSSLVHPREVFKGATINNSASVILFHNHPSGDTEPSKDDIEITHRLKCAGDILGIKVIDHLIFGSKGKHFSFAFKNIL